MSHTAIYPSTHDTSAHYLPALALALALTLAFTLASTLADNADQYFSDCWDGRQERRYDADHRIRQGTEGKRLGLFACQTRRAEATCTSRHHRMRISVT